MGITQINGLGKQIVRTSPVLPAQLESSDTGGVAQKGKVDQVIHSLKMTDAEQEKIAVFRKNIAESLRILDEIVEIIRFQDNPGDTVIDQKLEEIRKILSH